jgi:hypothetical protein
MFCSNLRSRRPNYLPCLVLFLEPAGHFISVWATSEHSIDFVAGTGFPGRVLFLSCRTTVAFSGSLLQFRCDCWDKV